MAKSLWSEMGGAYRFRRTGIRLAVQSCTRMASPQKPVPMEKRQRSETKLELCKIESKNVKEITDPRLRARSLCWLFLGVNRFLFSSRPFDHRLLGIIQIEKVL